MHAYRAPADARSCPGTWACAVGTGTDRFVVAANPWAAPPTWAARWLRLLLSGVCWLTLAVAGASAQSSAGQGEDTDPRCQTFLEQAAGHLAAEQYPTMLRVAEDRQRVCPGPVSAFLVGLAQANMVDNLLVRDPAERERMRQDALRSLKVAAAGGAALKPVWRFTAHDWIVYLQRLGPVDEPGAHGGASRKSLSAPSADVDLGPSAEDGPLPMPASPPKARPAFPWGPAILGVVAVGCFTGSLITGISSANEASRVQDKRVAVLELPPSPERTELERRLERNNAWAIRQYNWSVGLAIGGGLAVASAAVWYLMLPPEGGWRWSVTPTGLQVTGRF